MFMMCKKNTNLLIIFQPCGVFMATLFLLTACTRSNLIENVKDDAVVAVINGNDVAVKELRNEMNLLMRQFRVRDLNELTLEEKLILKTNGLNRIIHNVLLNIEADSNRISLTQNEYKDALDEVRREYHGDSFTQYLELEGIPFEIWNSKFNRFNKLLSQRGPSLSRSREPIGCSNYRISQIRQAFIHQLINRNRRI